MSLPDQITSKAIVVYNFYVLYFFVSPKIKPKNNGLVLNSPTLAIA